MELIQALRQLRADPSNAASPFLRVFEGDLTPDDEGAMANYPYPYAVVLGLPSTVEGYMLGGDTNMGVTLDVVLEHRPVSGKRPHKRIITELYHQTLRLRPHVTHLKRGVPLYNLEYLGGLEPSASYQSNTVLTATVRYRARYSYTL